jgi:sugar phosphate isomerase/epimerase
VTNLRFGVSTHLYHDHKLSRDHLAEIASFGFDAVEVFATRTHFDYHDSRAIDDLATWLDETKLRLHGIHAPIAKSLSGETWGETFSNASTDEAVRQQALREAAAALNIARAIPTDVFVVHLGTPAAHKLSAADNNRAAAARSIQDICSWADAAKVRLALEVIPNDLSSAEALVEMLEEDLEASEAGICLDFGHARLTGDLLDAIEVCSGHLITTHVHDNRGKQDDHLVPFDGTIDWSAALMAMQKIGYEGTYLFEVARTGAPAEVLRRTCSARRRFEVILGG